MRIVQQDSRQDQDNPARHRHPVLVGHPRQRARRPEAQGQPLPPGRQASSTTGPPTSTLQATPTATRRMDTPARSHPKFFMPLHGYHYMLRAHADVAKEANGLKEEDVVIPDNGSIIEIRTRREDRQAQGEGSFRPRPRGRLLRGRRPGRGHPRPADAGPGRHIHRLRHNERPDRQAQEVSRHHQPRLRLSARISGAPP